MFLVFENHVSVQMRKFSVVFSSILFKEESEVNEEAHKTPF